MPNLVAGSVVFSAHSNTFVNLVPGAGSDRLFFIGLSTESAGSDVADIELTSIDYRGQIATEVDSAWAAADNARGLQLFVFTEAQIQAIEAGSGAPVISRLAGNVVGTINQLFCFTLNDCDQSAITAATVSNLNTGGGNAFPHELTVAASNFDEVYFLAHLSQAGNNEWSGATEFEDNDATNGYSTTFASQTAIADGDVTAGVTSDSGNSYATAIIGFSIGAPAGPANQAPIANDDTFSVQDDVSNGTVVGTYTATDSDGTIAGYSITGTTLAIDNAGQITIADNTGITAGTPIIATVTATDDDGATDTATITVNVTSASAFRVDSVSAGPYYEDDTITLTVSNASVSGKGISIPSGAIPVDTESATEMTFRVSDLKNHGTKTSRYNQDITFTVTDGGASDTFTIQISPKVGEFYEVVTNPSGYTALGITGLVAGDIVYGYWLAGSGEVYLETGSVNSPDGGILRLWAYTQSQGSWGNGGNITINSTNTWSVFTTVTYTGDSVAPVISLVGASTIEVTIGQSFTDPGVTATDNNDGDISGSVVVGGDTVDTNTLGSYTLTYDVTDAAGNAATQVTRTVNVVAVVDNTPPVISLTGSASITLTQGDSFTDPGATASDNIDGNITGSIVVGGDTVDVNTVGSYTITYNVSDAEGNPAAQVTRTVTVQAPVVDNTAPIISLIGASTINITEGNAFVDPGASATDDTDGIITGDIQVTGTVDTNTVGQYILRYNVSDAAGNAATEVTRTVNVTAQPVVEPEELPTINTLSSTEIFIVQGGNYNLPNWTWDDDLTSGNAVSWDAMVIDTNVPGAYSRVATATNSVGTVTETLNVYVSSNETKTPVYIPRKLSTDVQEVSLFAGLGNWIEVTLSYDGEVIDLTDFVQFTLTGLTNDPLDSISDSKVFQVTPFGKLYIDGGSIPVEDLKATYGTLKTTLVGRTVEDTEGIMLWHPALDNSRVSVNVHSI